MANYIDPNGVISRLTLTRVQQFCYPRTGSDIYSYLDEVITRAEATIDGFARIRWQTPLPRSAMTDEWAYSLVEYELFKINSPGSQVPAKIKESWEMMMKQMMMMGEGKFEPAGATKLNSSTQVGHSVDVYSDPPSFTYCQTSLW